MKEKRKQVHPNIRDRQSAYLARDQMKEQVYSSWVQSKPNVYIRIYDRYLDQMSTEDQTFLTLVEE